ncbi:PIN domain-containing protein [Mesorhizobium sp. NBSH29]|uniref:type II toxin-antitoxin system VapC family toxin n=1 Tax=Mesorhizobium sp. NBSH29 TaxID=2654249 RepID=UPI001896533F|nr:type II toxin-antitoxin system VapC family toxin [Mesorhizobium sp. NBSH29]QPC85692.1 PIN domain-containing protein [Mesorhizobium sp. NBSH29]
MIVLDTHVLIWWVGDRDRIPSKTAALMDRELKNQGVAVSSISAWEIGMLVAKGRLKLAQEVHKWIGSVATIPGLRFIPVDNRVAINSVNLPGEVHGDPADRIIVALARDLGCSLVTADEKLHRYSAIETIW